MKREDAWKNFALGYELEIAGSFLFDGLRHFHEMQNFERTDQVFGFLYNLSVGFERLLKIAIILLEYSADQDNVKFNKSLISHNHPEFMRRIGRTVDPGLHKRHSEFLYLLNSFYKSFRYDRFTLPNDANWNSEKERTLLINFLQKHLGTKIKTVHPIYATPNDSRFRKFIGKLVSQICRALYNIIGKRAAELNLYTYELRYGSKAEKVFLGNCDFNSEDLIWKELLVFFMNTQKDSSLLRFMKSIDPLDLDPALAGEYLMCFQSETLKAFVVDEIEVCYEDIRDRKERRQMMDLIGDPNVLFDDDDEGNEG